MSASEKDKVSYDLALIYAQEMMRLYLKHQTDDKIFDTARLTKKLFCFFEEAYNAYLQMDDRNYIFRSETETPEEKDDFDGMFYPLFESRTDSDADAGITSLSGEILKA